MDVVGLLLDATALLDALPVREDERGLSVVLSTVLSPDRSVLCIISFSDIDTVSRGRVAWLSL